MNIRNNSGETALLCASERGHVEVVKVLLTLGKNVDVNMKDKSNGYAAVVCACISFHLEVIKVLLTLAKNIELNITSNSGDLPSFWLEDIVLMRL